MGVGGVLSASAPEIAAYIASFGRAVPYIIPQPTGIRWHLSGTNPSLGARRLHYTHFIVTCISIKRTVGGRGVLSASAPEIGAYIAPFRAVVH